MTIWFECKIQYDKIQQDGSLKAEKETNLVDALTFTEAEARIIKEKTQYISGDFKVVTIKKSNVSEIVWNESGDKWYLAKVAILETDPKTGKDKKTLTRPLVQASDFKEALDILLQYLKTWQSDTEVVSMNETAILDVYRMESEIAAE